MRSVVPAPALAGFLAFHSFTDEERQEIVSTIYPAILVSMPILLTASIFFFRRVATTPWKTVEEEISWSSIFLIVSGISLGLFLCRTGAAVWLALVAAPIMAATIFVIGKLNGLY